MASGAKKGRRVLEGLHMLDNISVTRLQQEQNPFPLSEVPTSTEKKKNQKMPVSRKTQL